MVVVLVCGYGDDEDDVGGVVMKVRWQRWRDVEEQMVMLMTVVAGCGSRRRGGSGDGGAWRRVIVEVSNESLSEQRSKHRIYAIDMSE
ncbi:hypothetical protein Tco_0186025 [Tanacetum coccineum]